MNKAIAYILLISSVLMGIQSCKKLTCYTIKGTITQWDYYIARFSKVRVFNAPEIYLAQSDSQSVRVESEENMFKALQFYIQPVEERLLVDFDEVCVDGIDRFRIFIGVEEFREADLIGDAKLYIEDTLRTGRLRILMKGAGRAEAFKLDADSVTTEITGSGNVYYSGIDTVDIMDVLISGSGGQYSFGLDSRIANVEVAGSGSVELTVRDTLNVEISGSGNVLYRGYPVINADISGSGTVIDSN